MAQEACKQSGNLWVPEFDQPASFMDLLEEIEDDHDCWMGSLHSQSTKLAPSLSRKKISLLIGPEEGDGARRGGGPRAWSIFFYLG